MRPRRLPHPQSHLLLNKPLECGVGDRGLLKKAF